MLGCHPVRVGRGSPCEQIGQPQVRELTPRAGEPAHLGAQLDGADQACLAMRQVRVGGHVGERGQVIADEARSRPGVQDLSAMAQSEYRTAFCPGHGNPERRLRRQRPGAARGVQLGLERRADQPQVVAERGHRKCVVGQQLGLSQRGRVHQLPPGAIGDGHAARYGRSAGHRDVPRRHLPLAGQHRKDLDVGREHQGRKRNGLVQCQPLERVVQVVGDDPLEWCRSPRLVPPTSAGRGWAQDHPGRRASTHGSRSSSH